MGASWSGIVTPINEPDVYKISSNEEAVHTSSAVAARPLIRTGFNSHKVHQPASYNNHSAASQLTVSGAAAVADPVLTRSMFAQHLHLMNTLTLKKLISSGTLSRPKNKPMMGGNNIKSEKEILRENVALANAGLQSLVGHNMKAVVTAHEATVLVGNAYAAAQQLPRTTIVDVIEDKDHAQKYGTIFFFQNPNIFCCRHGGFF